MTKAEKEELRDQNSIRFIEAAQELLGTEAPDKISIRKIADKAGFHNSTIYLYFKDVNELILMSSMKYFSEYTKALSDYSKERLLPKENFFMIWYIFCDIAFKNPQIFYNFFFGKHSGDISSIIKEYYRLFPDAEQHYAGEIEEMFYGKDFTARCKTILLPLTKLSTTRVTVKNVELLNNIIISCFKELLFQKCQNPELADSSLTKEFIDMLAYIIGLEPDSNH